MGAGFSIIICNDLEWPNLGFKVTGYLKVEYLAVGARVFNCTKHSCRSLGALPKTCKKLRVVAEFFAKSTGRCFTPLIEIKHSSVSLRWNFCVHIQLIRERFWLAYNCGWLKSSASHASRENNLLRCGNIRKWRVGLQWRFLDGRTNVQFSSTGCRRPPAGRVGGKANRLLGLANS